MLVLRVETLGDLRLESLDLERLSGLLGLDGYHQLKEGIEPLILSFLTCLPCLLYNLLALVKNPTVHHLHCKQTLKSRMHEAEVALIVEPNRWKGELRTIKWLPYGQLGGNGRVRANTSRLN